METEGSNQARDMPRQRDNYGSNRMGNVHNNNGSQYTHGNDHLDNEPSRAAPSGNYENHGYFDNRTAPAQNQGEPAESSTSTGKRRAPERTSANYNRDIYSEYAEASSDYEKIIKLSRPKIL